MIEGEKSFDSTLGLLEVGSILAAFLFGVCTAQVYTYYQNFPKDSNKLKAFVAGIWILECAHGMLVGHTIYTHTITNFGLPNDVRTIPPSLSAAVILSGIIGPAVQSFFAYRLSRLADQIKISILCYMLSFLKLLSLVGVGVTMVITPVIVEFKRRWHWILLTSLSLSAALDVIITGAQCFYLFQHRGKGFHHTQKLVDQMIAWTIQTGLLTSIATVTMLIFFVTMENWAWLMVFILISRLFSNSLLATLNARAALINRGPSFIDINSFASASGIHHRNHRDASRPHPITIEMTKIQETSFSNISPGSGSDVLDVTVGSQGHHRHLNPDMVAINPPITAHVHIPAGTGGKHQHSVTWGPTVHDNKSTAKFHAQKIGLETF